MLKASRSKGPWVQEWATVVSHDGQGDVYKLVLRAPEVARRAVAGQFVEVRCTAGRSLVVDPLLRRPFSICYVSGDTVCVIYRVVGRGTALLSSVGVGCEVDVMGPLGHSFPDPAVGTGRLVLVGGGLGIPPMVMAASRAVSVGRSVVAVVGARSAAYLAGLEELRATGVDVVVVTDDGSAGARGVVTGPLAAALADGAGEVWACGPEGMLQAVKELCAGAGVPCFVSVERHMACGFGACIGCTVPRADGPGYLKACQDGPVFAAEEVKLGGA
ncbi:MAG: dihydroorotate dehydrogenase electron transfer subunit [Symbiobacteriaceae bacterium]|jgi:dihydroorotate dehydrogenase electron transfer subunit|nr:dihydroorotate dehydrogenase electron transfer subunit [Symbiobacteriaceae bacterium]